MKSKILADFQIWISVPLSKILIKLKKLLEDSKWKPQLMIIEKASG